MTVFGQLGDPVAGAAACLCEHHGAAYAEYEPPANTITVDIYYGMILDGVVIVQQQITTTERCCVVVNAATSTQDPATPAGIEIERPLGTIRTTQRDGVISNYTQVMHHAAWEVLDPGTYTYFLVNRSGSTSFIFGAWLKIIASDCEG